MVFLQGMGSKLAAGAFSRLTDGNFTKRTAMHMLVFGPFGIKTSALTGVGLLVRDVATTRNDTLESIDARLDRIFDANPQTRDRDAPVEPDMATNQWFGQLAYSDKADMLNIGPDGTGRVLDPYGTPWKVHVVDVDTGAGDGGSRALVFIPEEPGETTPPAVIALAGTEQPIVDWATNAVGMFKVPASYQYADHIASSMAEQYGQGVVLTGHSKGGGEASYAAYMNGLISDSFNSAPLFPNAQRNIERAGFADEATVRHFRNAGDPVSSIHPLLGQVCTDHSKRRSSQKDNSTLIDELSESLLTRTTRPLVREAFQLHGIETMTNDPNAYLCEPGGTVGRI